MTDQPKILILNGPNLNFLGKRQPHLYGFLSLADLEQQLVEKGQTFGFKVECRQSNHEGVLIDWLQEAQKNHAGVLINPGAYAHTSIALGDCIASLRVPVVEVHLTAISQRELFRRHSYLAEGAAGFVAGFGPLSYELGLVVLAKSL